MVSNLFKVSICLSQYYTGIDALELENTVLVAERKEALPRDYLRPCVTPGLAVFSSRCSCEILTPLDRILAG
jgi:hypothetical protein